MRTEFAEAIQDAVQQPTSSQRVERIKRAVTTEMKAADPAVRVKFTDYFNHVVVPDMVLRWPNEAKERLLFLRPSVDRTWLSDDVAQVGLHQPVIFTLEDNAALPGAPEPVTSEELSAAASMANTWITGPSAIGQVIETRRKSTVSGLLGQALVRGGKGLSTEDSVQTLAAVTETAFQQAEAREAEPLTAGVRSIEASLDPTQAGRLTRVLRAVWEGHGGAGSSFPTVASTGPLTDDDLGYLLSTLGDASLEFWGRVGKTVTTSQLGRLVLEDPSPSLQRFVTANLDSLTAKGLRSSDQQVRLGESEQFPRWLIERGCLALRGQEWIAHFAARKSEELPPAETNRGVALADLRERVSKSRVGVTRIDFGKGDRSVSYESRERRDILDDEDLSAVAEDVQGMSVDRASISIDGGAVNLEFGTGTALGPTNSTLPLGALARKALPLLRKFDDEESGALQQLLAAGEQMRLALEPRVGDDNRELPEGLL